MVFTISTRKAGAAARLRRCPITIHQTYTRGELRMNLDERVGALIHQRTDPAGLRSRQEMADNPPGGQHQRVVSAGFLRWRPIGRYVEMGLAIGEVKRPLSLGYGIP